MEEDFTNLPRNQKEAKSLGSRFYFTGRPCKNGHVHKRRTCNNNCNACEYRYHKEWRADNIDHDLETKRLWRERNPDYMNNYYEDNKDKRREYLEHNRDKIRKTKRESQRKQYKDDLNFRTTKMCRGFLYRTLKSTGDNKSSSTSVMLGYTNKELLRDIERKFLDGMTWENYGDWHVDHKTPICRYIEDGITDPSIINSLDNLIPMWSNHNSEKNDRTLEEYLEINPHLKELYGEGL